MCHNNFIDELFNRYEKNITDSFVPNIKIDESEIIFEDKTSDYNTVNKIRFNKFFRVLIDARLPWYIRQSMLDLFPKIESYFYTSKRTNFINMNQLAIEMCRVLGYQEWDQYFITLKTKNRVKQVREFVDRAVEYSGYSNYPNLKRLDDIPFITLQESPEMDMRRVSGEHIYVDIRVLSQYNK